MSGLANIALPGCAAMILEIWEIINSAPQAPASMVSGISSYGGLGPDCMYGQFSIIAGTQQLGDIPRDSSCRAKAPSTDCRVTDLLIWVRAKQPAAPSQCRPCKARRPSASNASAHSLPPACWLTHALLEVTEQRYRTSLGSQAVRNSKCNHTFCLLRLRPKL